MLLFASLQLQVALQAIFLSFLYFFSIVYNFSPPGKCSSTKRRARGRHRVGAEWTPNLSGRGLSKPCWGHHPDAPAQWISEVSEASEVHSERVQDELFCLQGPAAVKLEKPRRLGQLEHRADLLHQLEGLWSRTGGEHPPGQVWIQQQVTVIVNSLDHSQTFILNISSPKSFKLNV